ncbi:MAG: YceI family protein [Flavobacteriaceae bacterium]|nr:YceI family protein [Psychroflexus sp.]
MKKMIKGLTALTVLFAFVAFTNNTVQKKKIDIKKSEIEWEGEKLTGSHNGTIQLKEGFLLMENNELVGGEFTVDMTSINVVDLSGEDKQKLEGHLSSDDFFGVKDHPTAKLVFKTVAKKSGSKYGVSGDLTIKGQTNPIAFDLEMEKNEAEIDLVIDRSKYGIKYGSDTFFDNLGDKTIYDEFKLDIDLKF